MLSAYACLSLSFYSNALCLSLSVSSCLAFSFYSDARARSLSLNDPFSLSIVQRPQSAEHGAERGSVAQRGGGAHQPRPTSSVQRGGGAGRPRSAERGSDAHQDALYALDAFDSKRGSGGPRCAIPEDDADLGDASVVHPPPSRGSSLTRNAPP